MSYASDWLFASCCLQSLCDLRLASTARCHPGRSHHTCLSHRVETSPSLHGRQACSTLLRHQMRIGQRRESSYNQTSSCEGTPSECLSYLWLDSRSAGLHHTEEKCLAFGKWFDTLWLVHLHLTIVQKEGLGLFEGGNALACKRFWCIGGSMKCTTWDWTST
jgi:hypothetical protein